jgi:hypothetical protein
MLLCSGIGVFGHHIIHRRTAAVYYRARGIDHSYKVATAFTYKKVAFLVHILPPFHCLLLSVTAVFIRRNEYFGACGHKLI